MRGLTGLLVLAATAAGLSVKIPGVYEISEAVDKATTELPKFSFGEDPGPTPGPTPGPEEDDKCDWAVFHDTCEEYLGDKTMCMHCAEHRMHETPCSAEQATAFCGGEEVEECVEHLYDTCFHHVEEGDDCIEVCSSACIAHPDLTPSEGAGAACTAEDHNNQSSLTAGSCQAFCFCFDRLREAHEAGEEDGECRDVSSTCLTPMHVKNGTEVPDFTAYDKMVKHLCEAEEEEENEFNLKLRILLVIAGVLIALTIAFEMVEEFLTDLINKDFLPILQHVYSELTILGFVGLIMFILTKSGVLQSYSKSMFWHPPPDEESDDDEACDPEEHEAESELTELVEGAHMVLFFVMLCFLTQIGIMLWMTQRRMAVWRKWEAAHAAPADISEDEKETACVEAIAKQMAMFSHPEFLPKCIHWMNPLNWYRLKNNEQKRLYLALRAGFVHPTKTTRKLLKQKAMRDRKSTVYRDKLPSDFEFYKYLNKIMAANLLEIVQVEKITWFFVATFFVAFWILIRFIDERTDILFFCMIGAVWALLAFLRWLNFEMEAIADRLCPRHLHNAAREHHVKLKRQLSARRSSMSLALGSDSTARSSLRSLAVPTDRTSLLPQTAINSTIYEDAVLPSQGPASAASSTGRRGDGEMGQKNGLARGDSICRSSIGSGSDFDGSDSEIDELRLSSQEDSELRHVGDESNRIVNHRSGRVYPNCEHRNSPDHPLYHVNSHVENGGHVESPFWRWAYGFEKKTDVIDRHTRLLPGKLAAPEYVKSALRISLLLISMFVGVSLQVFLLDIVNGDGHFDGYEGSTRGIVLALAVLPNLFLLHTFLEISAHLAMSCNTELLKDAKVVGFVLEIMKVTRVIQKLIPVAEAMMAHAEAGGHEDPKKSDPAHQRHKPTSNAEEHHSALETMKGVLSRATASAHHIDPGGFIWIDMDTVAKTMRELDLLPHTLLTEDGNSSSAATTKWLDEQMDEMGRESAEICVKLEDLETHLGMMIHHIQSHHTNNKHSGLVDFIWKVIRENGADEAGAEDDGDEDAEGDVEAEALQAVFAKYGVEISVGEIEDIIHSVDKDGDGKINKEEFHALLKLAEIGEDD